MEKQIQTISTNADGRAFLGVDEHKGYVGTSNGIFILDLDKQELLVVWREPQMVEVVLTVPYTHSRAHETSQDLVCPLLLVCKKNTRISHVSPTSSLFSHN
ncbi:DUF5074 domain-containing protein, partial [Segatella copri]|uniref:DUF5074 domain-containing protein n=1 Tax=Segatella copri TaxID=165179 RepID=UPI001F2957D2